MKIALVSAPVKTGDIEFNIASMTDAMRAVCGRADVIVFGESVLQGFDSLCWDYEQTGYELSSRNCAWNIRCIDFVVSHNSVNNGHHFSAGMTNRSHIWFAFCALL